MNTLELYYPTKPYIVTQAWGVYNPDYIQFGFDKHNGIDIAVDKDGYVKAMCDGVVTRVENQSGGGLVVRYRTGPVLCEGTECYVEFAYLHASKQLVKEGQVVKAGDNLIIAGNTGFSTGPHTHIAAYRLDKNTLAKLDNNADANFTFDHSKYYNGKYADDIAETKTYYFDTNLSLGSRGEKVKYLQTFLVEQGYLPADCITGFYGPKTRNAVYRLQIDYQMPLGAGWLYLGYYFGLATRTFLNKMYENNL